MLVDAWWGIALLAVKVLIQHWGQGRAPTDAAALGQGRPYAGLRRQSAAAAVGGYPGPEVFEEAGGDGKTIGGTLELARYGREDWMDTGAPMPSRCGDDWMDA